MTNLLETFKIWTDALDEGYAIDCSYLPKAFDTVPHGRLIKKLQAYGICGKLSWISDFLHNRFYQPLIW